MNAKHFGLSMEEMLKVMLQLEIKQQLETFRDICSTIINKKNIIVTMAFVLDFTLRQFTQIW